MSNSCLRLWKCKHDYFESLSPSTFDCRFVFCFHFTDSIDRQKEELKSKNVISVSRTLFKVTSCVSDILLTPFHGRLLVGMFEWQAMSENVKWKFLSSTERITCVGCVDFEHFVTIMKILGRENIILNKFFCNQI